MQAHHQSMHPAPQSSLLPRIAVTGGTGYIAGRLVPLLRDCGCSVRWRIRGWLDLLVGGPGPRRGRRHPGAAGYGEALDFWRVAGFERNRRLPLRAEMRLPGEAPLEFPIKRGSGSQRKLQQVALFNPRGLLGCSIGVRRNRFTMSFCVGFNRKLCGSPPTRTGSSAEFRRIGH